MRSALSVAALLCLTSLSQRAHAFVPVDGQGAEPERIRHYDARTQHELRQQGPWREFLRSDGAGWSARFDQLTGTPHRMWGKIELSDTRSAAAVESQIRDLVARHRGLFGADNSDLELANAVYVPERHTWHVRFNKLVGGAPIWRGGFTAWVKHGNLVMMAVDTYPDATVVNEVGVDMVQAIAAALDEGPAPGAEHSVENIELLAIPEVDRGEAVLRMVWAVNHKTQTPIGDWITMVDAGTGEVAHYYNQVRFFEGLVQGEHDDRYPAGDFDISPMPLLDVSSDAASGETDDDGIYDLDGTYFEAKLQGDLLTVRNYAGSNGEKSWTSDDAVATWTEDDATLAEIDTYVFVNEVFVWGQRVAPEVSYVDTRLRSTVNIDSACNAYYDGNINFYAYGSSGGTTCNNTGRIADVNYHEWGHGFHYYSVYTGGGSYYDVDGSIGEGSSDVVSLFQTGDPRVAPYFYPSGGAIRNADNTMQYPENYYSGYVHSNGTIFSGSMYDFILLETEESGEAAAIAAAEDIFVGLLQTGPDVESSYDAALLADDDDGDLSNGTPHYCTLNEAFGLHGLNEYGTVAAASGIEVGFSPDPFWTPGVDIEVTASVFESTIDCLDAEPESATVFWRLAGDEDYEEVALDLTGSDISGAIPAQEEGAIVEYYVELTDSDGGTVQAPTYGEYGPVTTYVGALTEVYCEDFESGDGDFVGRMPEGPSGGNEWEHGEPEGESYDPTVAASGDNVWGLDLSDDGEYREEGEFRLRSPWIDVAGYDTLYLVYNRWLSVEDGYYDQAWIEANDEVVWLNHESRRSIGDQHHIDTQWVEHVVELPAANEDGEVRIGFHLQSDAGLHLGGWNVDDVCIYARSADAGSDTEANDTDGEDTDATVDNFTGDDIISAGGCSCSAAPTAAGMFGWLTLLAPVWLGRRRQR